MKKLLLILTILFSLTINSQEGYWLFKDYRVIDSTKGWRNGNVGLIIDFTNSKMTALMKDTVVDVVIDKKRKEISHEKDTLKLRYKFINNVIEIKEDNIVNKLYKLEFREELNFSKDSVFNLLVLNKIKKIRNSLTINFTNKENYKSYYNSNIRVLEFRSNKLETERGIWFLESIEGNLFLGLNFGYHEDSQYYRITSIDKSGIGLESIFYPVDFLQDRKLKKIEFEN